MNEHVEHLRARTGRRPLRGIWITLLGADALEVLPQDRLAWVGIDLQHGCLEVADLAALLRSTPLPVLVRTASQDPAHLARVLDTGATGVVVPGVESAAECAALVAAVRPPPEGRRSTGASRSAAVGGPRSPLLLPMVETRAGLAAAEDIAGHAGVDGVFVGPYDLSLSLGRPSVVDDEVVEAIRTVAAVARRHGRLVGAFSGDPALESLLPETDLLAVDSDVGVLRRGVHASFGGPDGATDQPA